MLWNALSQLDIEIDTEKKGMIFISIAYILKILYDIKGQCS